MYTVFEELIKERGLKVSDVCRATGIRSGVFSDWKMGRYTPKSDKLKKVADFLGVPLLYLMTGEGKFDKQITHTNEEYEVANNILKMYGWEVSRNNDGIAISDNGVVYTVTENSYESFCEDVTQFLDNAVDKLLHGHVVSITLKSVDGAIPQDKIQSIARMLNNEMPIAAHATDEDIDGLNSDRQKIEERIKNDI